MIIHMNLGADSYDIVVERGMRELYHGECVALGMIPMCGEAVRPHVIEVLKKMQSISGT